MGLSKLLRKELMELREMKKCDPNDIICRLENYQQLIKENPLVYFDDSEDHKMKQKYYRNISIRKGDLFNQYHELLTNSHQHSYPYFYSKDQYLYTFVDLHPDGKLVGIYSGKKIDPLALIEEDFMTLNKRYNSYHTEFHSDRPFEENEENIAKLQLISKQHRFNTEHVVPQSWFYAREPMKGDLHHLFICEPICNNLRSNHPFYQHPDGSEFSHVRLDCGKQNVSGFEPAYGKGVVARATLYFLVRYPNVIHKKNLKRINLSTLIKWHHVYGVTLYEKHRNKAIAEIQGNRNPFIDHPDLVNHLHFPF